MISDDLAIVSDSEHDKCLRFRHKRKGIIKVGVGVNNDYSWAGRTV